MSRTKREVKGHTKPHKRPKQEVGRSGAHHVTGGAIGAAQRKAGVHGLKVKMG